MFKDNDVEQEIYKSMEANMVNNQLENKYAFNKIAKSIDYLHLATKLFDKAGMHQEADQLTNIVKEICNKINKNKTFK